MNEIKQVEALKTMLIRDGYVFYKNNIDSNRALINILKPLREVKFEQTRKISTEELLSRLNRYNTFETNGNERNYFNEGVKNNLIREIQFKLEKEHPFSISVIHNSIEVKHIENIEKRESEFITSAVILFYECDLINMDLIEQLHEARNKLVDKFFQGSHDIEIYSRITSLEEKMYNKIHNHWKNDSDAEGIPFYLWYALHYGQ